MGDVTSMFVVYLLELLQWTNDTEIAKELWPNAKKAAEWQIGLHSRERKGQTVTLTLTLTLSTK